MPVKNVIEVALGELGVTENPPGSNRVKYWDEYGAGWQGQPWCVCFLWWCFQRAGEGQSFFGGGKTASCGTLLRWYSAQDQTVAKSALKPGDIVILNFSGTSDTQHCGIVVDTLKMGYFQTIEGNTSQSGPQSNGGQVCLKTRNLSHVVGVCRPKYKEEEPVMADDLTEHWAEASCRKAKAKAIMKGYPDGDWKPDKQITRAELAVVLDRLGLLDD